jgi:hypothetical protein
MTVLYIMRECVVEEICSPHSGWEAKRERGRDWVLFMGTLLVPNFLPLGSDS